MTHDSRLTWDARAAAMSDEELAWFYQWFHLRSRIKSEGDVPYEKWLCIRSEIYKRQAPLEIEKRIRELRELDPDSFSNQFRALEQAFYARCEVVRTLVVRI